MTAIAAPTPQPSTGSTGSTDDDQPGTPTAPVGAPVPGIAWTVLRGLGGGIALGATYRAWMRLVSTNPEFSWSGTLFIIGVVTVVVLLSSIASTVRLRARRRVTRGAVRVLSTAAFVLLASGPGAVTVPVWVFGGLAWGRRTWPRWIRLLLAAGAVGGLGLFVVVTAADAGELGYGRTAAAYITYVPLMGVIARLFAIPTRSSEPAVQ